MNKTQSIWVVLLIFTFIVAYQTTPILSTSNSQNDTTINNGYTAESCPEEFTDYSNIGGYCFYLEERQTRLFEKCLKTFYGIPENVGG